MGKTRSPREEIDARGSAGITLNCNEPRWRLVGFDPVKGKLTRYIRECLGDLVDQRMYSRMFHCL